MKRVLILSQPLSCNYGCLLQAFALQKIVKSFGFEVVTNSTKLKVKHYCTTKNVLGFCYRKAKLIAKKIMGYDVMTPQKFKTISQNTQKFIDKYIENQHIETLSEDIIQQHDVFIVGSDQVFRKLYSQVTAYFLEALRDRNDKIKLGRHITIRDNNGNHFLNRQGYKNSRPVIIGDKCWLTESCTIMPGVKIGDGAIVGALSFVIKNVPPNVVVSGHPAEIVDEDVLWKY